MSNPANSHLDQFMQTAIAEVLNNIKDSHGLTFKDMGERIGVNTKTVAKYTYGQAMPSLQTCLAIDLAYPGFWHRVFAVARREYGQYISTLW